MQATATGPALLDLFPGKGLGPFRLGLPLCDALAASAALPARAAGVQVRYDAERPLCSDIVLHLEAGGFRLWFEPRAQQLRLVEIYDLSRARLRYCGRPLGGSPQHATFAHLCDTLGPTFPGSFDAERSIVVVRYPGLELHFAIPPQHAAAVAEQSARPGAAHPLELPDGTAPACVRALLHAGGVSTAAAAAVPPTLPHSTLPLSYMEEVRCTLGVGLHFQCTGHELPFGCGAQDAWAALGPPEDVQRRTVDAMGIHGQPAAYSGEGEGEAAADNSYFFRYYSRGIDLLFDGDTHTLKKAVVRANWPGHADFNVYARCNFVICDGPAAEERRVLCTVASSWGECAKALGPASGPAVNMAPESPFGHTLVYGARCAAVEVMPSSSAIASVTLTAA